MHHKSDILGQIQYIYFMYKIKDAWQATTQWFEVLSHALLELPLCVWIFCPFLLALLGIIAYRSARYLWERTLPASMEMSTFFMLVNVISCLSKWWCLYVTQHIVTKFWKWERHHWGQTRSWEPSGFLFSPSLGSKCIRKPPIVHHGTVSGTLQCSFAKSSQHCCHQFINFSSEYPF